VLAEERGGKSTGSRARVLDPVWVSRGGPEPSEWSLLIARMVLAIYPQVFKIQ